ncbi:hypothetical protein F3Y22_tig00111769pilonHSYRG00557 [Hibiscus syriacus]|uniref:Uncharacterized protein n=1 Tax=Hibiscus syriacus TaxID=106335 RepID=A0A6A2XEI8_HIBSY|nr:hypothetical protein F3Y22_tig00111769pilonHSYRG00557 [Hibiscus syriacus]
MPETDIATAKPSLQGPLVPARVQVLSNTWKSSPLPTRINFHVGHQENHCGKLQVRAVATLKPKFPKQDGTAIRHNLEVIQALHQISSALWRPETRMMKWTRGKS